MEIIEKYSQLHKELQLQEYLIPFKELDKIETKEEFIEYCQYFQIDKEYLLKQICECKYLNFLCEYMNDNVVQLLKEGRYKLDNEYYYNILNDENLKYISQYIEIVELFAFNNSKITIIQPFAKTLKFLHAGGNCGIDDNGLKNCNNLESLEATDNPKITTVKPFAKTLKILHACGYCGIDDNGLKGASNLEELYDNPNITTIKPFANTIKILYAYGNSGIDDKGLEGAINLQKLYSHGNPKITKKLNKK